MLEELLEVLLSIIRPQAAAPSTSSSSSSSQSGSLATSTSTPSSTSTNPQRTRQLHDQALRLRSVLDPDLISQELRHGLYDPSGTFRVIGEVLKAHCAPMRDQAVDRMVELAGRCAPGGGGGKGEAVEAMRKCFEVLEMMKLVSCFFVRRARGLSLGVFFF